MNEELLERVGPGWRTLVAEFCEEVEAAGFVADSVRAVAGVLLVEWSDPEPEAVADKRERLARLRVLAGILKSNSTAVCEGCGDAGSLVKREDEYYGTQLKTLCSACAYRWSASGFSQWSEITGRLDPLDKLIADSNDGIDPDDDLDEGRREPPPIRPRPIAGGGAAIP